MSAALRPRAVFLDRDGTLCRERGFVTEPAQLEILPGVPEALARLAAAGFLPLVLTNQSGIAQGLYSERDLAHIHAVLHEKLSRIPRAYLHCPHHPEAVGSPYGGACNCRKPRDGLLFQALEFFDLALEGSYLIGDSARDLLMGPKLPLSRILVRTGKPWRQEAEGLEKEGLAFTVVEDLPAAVELLISA